MRLAFLWVFPSLQLDKDDIPWSALRPRYFDLASSILMPLVEEAFSVHSDLTHETSEEPFDEDFEEVVVAALDLTVLNKGLGHSSWRNPPLRRT